MDIWIKDWSPVDWFVSGIAVGFVFTASCYEIAKYIRLKRQRRKRNRQGRPYPIQWRNG